MAASGDDRLVLGYIVVTEKDGWVGGYLCTDERGVPLEFRYTSGVKTDGMQELLYGRTLKPELFGRHIAGALLKDAVRTPTVVLAEEEAVLSGFTHESPPILQVLSADGADETQKQQDTRRIRTGCGEVLIRWRQRDADEIDGLVAKLTGVDVLEPFDRIRALLNELAREGAAAAGE